ncbi:hypothetical protein DPMN_026650 [Dreissena polymorpha]|uniref:Uncharacterized protein n=1 Tax=Dreissena polymorpha TaxID=45954 RepID=A0A9D4LTD2_DREPO|nr:hypothetical protein DPMN_026650 [Dreissena polymorpha]
MCIYTILEKTASLAVRKPSDSRVADSAGLAEPPAEVPIYKEICTGERTFYG